MRAIGQYFLVVLFVLLEKVALTFEYVDDTLQYDYSIVSVQQYFTMKLCFTIFFEKKSEKIA